MVQRAANLDLPFLLRLTVGARSETSQISTVVSSLPEASSRPSAENASALTRSPCPVSNRHCLPETTSHNWTSLSPISGSQCSAVRRERQADAAAGIWVGVFLGRQTVADLALIQVPYQNLIAVFLCRSQVSAIRRQCRIALTIVDAPLFYGLPQSANLLASVYLSHMNDRFIIRTTRCVSHPRRGKSAKTR